MIRSCITMVVTRGQKEADRQGADRARLLLLHSQLVHRRFAHLLSRMGVSVAGECLEMAMEDISCAVCYGQLGEECGWEGMIEELSKAAKGPCELPHTIRDQVGDLLLLQVQGVVGEWVVGLLCGMYPCGLSDIMGDHRMDGKGGQQEMGLEPFPTGLDSCSHLFCFTCINQWATQSTRCPMCRQRFKAVSLFPYWLPGLGTAPSSDVDKRVALLLAAWTELRQLFEAQLVLPAALRDVLQETCALATPEQYLNSSPLLIFTATVIVAAQAAVHTATVHSSLGKTSRAGKWAGEEQVTSSVVDYLRKAGFKDRARGSSVCLLLGPEPVGLRGKGAKSARTGHTSADSNSGDDGPCTTLGASFGVALALGTPPHCVKRVDVASMPREWLPLMPLCSITNPPANGDFLDQATKEMLPYVAAALAHLHRGQTSTPGAVDLWNPSPATAPFQGLCVSLLVRGILGLVSVTDGAERRTSAVMPSTSGVLPIVEVRYAAHDYFHRHSDAESEENEQEAEGEMNAEDFIDWNANQRRPQAAPRQRRVAAAQPRRRRAAAAGAHENDDDAPISALVARRSFECRVCHLREFNVPTLLMCSRPDCTFTAHRTCLVNELLPVSGADDCPLTLANLAGAGALPGSRLSRRRDLYSLLSPQDYECTSCLLKADPRGDTPSSSSSTPLAMPSFFQEVGGQPPHASPAPRPPPVANPMPVTVKSEGRSTNQVAGTTITGASRGRAASAPASGVLAGESRARALDLIERMNSGRGLHRNFTIVTTPPTTTTTTTAVTPLFSGLRDQNARTMPSVQQQAANTMSFVSQVEGDHRSGLAFLDDRSRELLRRTGSSGSLTQHPASRSVGSVGRQPASLVRTSSTILRRVPSLLDAEKEEKALAEERRAQVVRRTLEALERKKRAQSHAGPIFDAFGNIAGTRDPLTTHNGMVSLQQQSSTQSVGAFRGGGRGTLQSAASLEGETRYLPSQRELMETGKERDDVPEAMPQAEWGSARHRHDFRGRAEAAGDAYSKQMSAEMDEVKAVLATKAAFVKRAREQVALERLRAVVQSSRRAVVERQRVGAHEGGVAQQPSAPVTAPPQPMDVGDYLADLWLE